MAQRKLKQSENANHHLFLRGEWWWCEYELQGQRERVSLRTTDVQAARAERDRLIAAAKAIREGRPIETVRTWTEAVGDWLEWVETARSLSDETRKRYICSARMWSDVFGPGPGRHDMPLADIGDDSVQKFVAERLKLGRKTSTIRNDLTALSSLLQHAIEKHWITYNPALALNRDKWLGSPSEFDEVNPPTDAELAATLPHIRAWRPDMELLLLFMRETGTRLFEALSFDTDWLHEGNQRATLFKGTKGRKIRVISMCRAAALLDRLPSKGRIFPEMPLDSAAVASDIGQWWRLHGEGLKLRRFRQHDLRHGFACASIVDDDECIYRLQQQLGHGSVKVTEVYTRVLNGGLSKWPEGRRPALFGSLSDRVPTKSPHTTD